MKEDEVVKLIQDQIKLSQKSALYGATNYTYHTHNNLDSPIIPFTSLGGVPNSYMGQAGKILTVNPTASGLEFTTSTGGASHVMVYNSGNQTISSGTDTVVVLDFEYYDTLGEFSSNRFTATQAGYYTVSASMSFFGASAVDTIAEFTIQRHNALPMSDTRSVGTVRLLETNTYVLTANVSGIAYLDAGDWIELHTQRILSANYTILANSFLEISSL